MNNGLVDFSIAQASGERSESVHKVKEGGEVEILCFVYESELEAYSMYYNELHYEFIILKRNVLKIIYYKDNLLGV